MTGPPAATLFSPHVRRSRQAGAALIAALALLAGACSSPSEPSHPDPPSLSCPVGVTATSPDGQPVAVAYTTPVAVGGEPPVTVSCQPASGSAFPVGITTVTCTARDSLGRQGGCSFSVQVTVPPQLSATKFLAFGDSLTEGKIASSAVPYVLYDFPGSYPRQLQDRLRARYTAQSPTVTNDGLGGEMAVQGVRRLPGDLATYAPQAALLMEGANDLNNSHAADHVEPAAEAMRQMVLLAQASGASAFLATLPPQRAGARNAAGAAYVEPYNARIRTIAAETGAVLVDVWTGFNGAATTDLVGPDGLHLTAAGYDKMAEIFYEAIREHLELQPSAQ